MPANKSVNAVILTAMVSLLPFSFVSFGPVDIDMFKIMLAISVVMYGAAVAVHREMAVIPGDRQFVLLLVLLAYALCSGLWAKDILLTLSYTFGLALFVFFYLLVTVTTRTPKDLSRWVSCIPLAVIIVIAYDLNKYFELAGLRQATSEALIGILGVVAAISILPIAYVYLISRKFVTTGYSLAMLVGCGMALIASANRIASVVAFLNIVLFSAFLLKARWISRKRKRRVIKFLVLTVAAGLAAFIIIASTSAKSAEWYKARIYGTISPEYQYHKTSYYWRDNIRIQLWDAGLRMAESSPLLGIGFGNFKAKVLNYYPHWEKGNIAHNIYLSTLAETGPLGLGLLVVLLGTSVYNYRAIGKALSRGHREREFILVKALEITFWGLLIHSAFRSTLYEFPLYLFMALSECCRRILIRGPRG